MADRVRGIKKDTKTKVSPKKRRKIGVNKKPARVVERKSSGAQQQRSKKNKPEIILTTGVQEGPAKQNTTTKTFAIPFREEFIDVNPITFAKGGKVKLALRGGGRAYNKNS